jgi:hypothetical protein
MQVLTQSVDTFDQVNTFTVEVRGFRAMKTIKASLHCGYQKHEDGIFWAMKHSTCLKDVYTEADREESTRLASMTSVRHGDLVVINGEQYKVRVLGDFSDCAIFEKV